MNETIYFLNHLNNILSWKRINSRPRQHANTSKTLPYVCIPPNFLKMYFNCVYIYVYKYKENVVYFVFYTLFLNYFGPSKFQEVAWSWSSPLQNKILMWLHQICDCQKGVELYFHFSAHCVSACGGGWECVPAVRNLKIHFHNGFPFLFPPCSHMHHTGFYYMVYLNTGLG